jgi:hypothetical protein
MRKHQQNSDGDRDPDYDLKPTHGFTMRRDVLDFNKIREQLLDCGFVVSKPAWGSA